MQLQNIPRIGDSNEGSVRPLVESVFRYGRLWIAVVALTIAVTVAFVLLIPKQYESEMSILVQNARSNYQITPQRTTSTIDVNGITEEQINSEIQVLRSRTLADEVVDPQWSTKAIDGMSPAALKAHERAVGEFTKNLSVDMVRKSNVIHVAYTARSPKVATATLDRLLAAFLAKQRDIGHPPGTYKFFASEANRYKGELDVAQQQLAQYQQDHQLVSLPDREQTLDRQIADAEGQLRSTDAQLGEMTQRLNAETAELKHVPARQQTQERIAQNDYSVGQLNTMLAVLENKRTTLLTKFTPTDRLVLETDKQIADTKAALSNAERLRSQQRSSDVNPVWEQVTGAIEQNVAERQALKAQHSELTKQISQLQSTLAGIEGSTVAFTTLHQKVAELTNNYQLYAQKRDEARMADAMDADKLLNVAVAQAPTFSIMPSRPKPVLDVALGSFTAIFLASFMVFFAEMGRSTIATPRELDAVSRYPLLATVPNLPQSDDVPTREGEPASSTRLAISHAHVESTLRPVYERSRKGPKAS
ncbi:GumC family protein [Acidipila rosea]|uniref:Uncharacterized protein involved in exopolysaccharide biosynthesis n=1 Tax=Acidipila rosea TaxID=768535 RepID=A0A4R1L4L2_9BACT|nr:Wzz/FepE/Etk N-terminal domain-containing protein [Acidipila rosea]TCK72057.1 uncharacterized protein involved in exopolysaccharide biosynthesis [Acidipila rosea]